MPHSSTRGYSCIRLSPVFSPTFHNKLFSQAEIRAISELRVRLVEAFQYMHFFCWQFQGGADFVDHFLNLYFMLLYCFHLEIYMIKTWPLPVQSGGVCGGGGNQDVVRLVLTGCGIAMSEIFGEIREGRWWPAYSSLPSPTIKKRRWNASIHVDSLFVVTIRIVILFVFRTL